MIEQLPDGKSIGWMQAPPQWIFTHTQRFMGIVRIVIPEGLGFILIRKGHVLAYYFRVGRIELTSKAALDYINSNPAVEFNLCRYTHEEMEQTLRILNIRSGAEEIQPVLSGQVPAEEPVTLKDRNIPSKQKNRFHSGEDGQNGADDIPGQDDESLFEPRRHNPVRITPAPPYQEYLDDPDITVISQIKKMNGIVAILVFDENRNIMMMGDVEIEPLLDIARSLLETTKKVTPLIEWGPFVHMTLQIPDGNIIVAPFREYFICVLTMPTINIGHIRRILRDIQMTEDGPE